MRTMARFPQSGMSKAGMMNIACRETVTNFVQTLLWVIAVVGIAGILMALLMQTRSCPLCLGTSRRRTTSPSGRRYGTSSRLLFIQRVPSTVARQRIPKAA